MGHTAGGSHRVRYFHFSGHPFQPGEIVLPAQDLHGCNEPAWNAAYRPDAVYLFDEVALHHMDLDPPWAPRLFEVRPNGPVEPDPERAADPHLPVAQHSWITTSATVLHEVDMYGNLLPAAMSRP